MTAKTLLPTNSSFLSLKTFAVFGFLAFCLCFPDIAAASGGITEFSSPLERVVNTITGPAGKWISIVAMALCGIIFIMNNDENKVSISPFYIYLFCIFYWLGMT